MANDAILFRANFGIPGDISRDASRAIVMPQAFNPSLPFPGYGLPGKLAGGFFVPVAGAADVVDGWLVRPFPTQGVNASDGIGVGVPRTSGECNEMIFGFMNVFCQNGTPAQGGQVFVRYAATSGAQIIGGVEATFQEGSNFAIPNCAFVGPADASGNCEIRFGM